MSMVSMRPTSAGRRHATIDNEVRNLSSGPTVKKLLGKTKKRAGRNNSGRITVRRRGGGHKRKMRRLDFVRRDKLNVPGKVVGVEYDPNRSANIALVIYNDGDKRYILAPDGLKIGATIQAGEKIDPTVGNALPLKNIPAGTPIHSLELKPGRGAQLVRGAGVSALIQSQESGKATVLLPSREIRLIDSDCFATIGQVGNVSHRTRKIGKAGISRHMGRRPKVRGVAQNPGSHPHGGGEGRSGIGMPSPKSPWGKKTLGKKTRKKKRYSNKSMVRDRRSR